MNILYFLVQMRSSSCIVRRRNHNRQKLRGGAKPSLGKRTRDGGASSGVTGASAAKRVRVPGIGKGEKRRDDDEYPNMHIRSIGESFEYRWVCDLCYNNVNGANNGNGPLLFMPVYDAKRFRATDAHYYNTHRNALSTRAFKFYGTDEQKEYAEKLRQSVDPSGIGKGNNRRDDDEYPGMRVMNIDNEKSWVCTTCYEAGAPGEIFYRPYNNKRFRATDTHFYNMHRPALSSRAFRKYGSDEQRTYAEQLRKKEAEAAGVLSTMNTLGH